MPPRASRPQLAMPIFTSKPLANQGTPVATRIATMVINQTSSSRWTRGFSQTGRGMSCVLSTFGLTRESLWLLGGNCHVALGTDGTVAEVVVLEERLSLHFLPAGWLEVLDMQGKRMRAQDLVAAQYGRITDDIDAVKFCLNDG